MATLVKTDLGKWKAVIRKTGWPTASKTFRTKRDAEDWARRTEDDMVRGAYIQRASADRMTVEDALKRYLAEVTPTKRPSSQGSDNKRSKILIEQLGKYSLAALTPEIIAKFREARLAGEDRKDAKGKPIPRANDTVRLDLALLGHLFTVAIKEWGIGLPSNPVMNIRRPAPGPGRNRRLSRDEEKRLLDSVDKHSNPMLRWIVRIALETGMRASEILTLASNAGGPETSHCSPAGNEEHHSTYCATQRDGSRTISRSDKPPCSPHRYRPDLLWRTGQRWEAATLPIQSRVDEDQTQTGFSRRSLP